MRKSPRLYRFHVLHTAFALLALLCVTIFTPRPARAAPLTVTNNNDSGTGSLRQVITGAASGDIITFTPNVTGKIVLTGGAIAITTNLTIIGPGPSILALDGNQHDGSLSINASSTVLVSGLTFQNGVGGIFANTIRSAAIANDGTLTIINCIFDGNSGSDNGAIVGNTGILTVLSSVFRDNHNIDFIGFNNGPGGILSSGVLVVTGSIFERNDGDEGAAIETSGTTTTTIRDSTFSKNTGSQGAVFLSSGNSIIEGSTFIFNDTGITEAAGNPGTLKISNSTISNNSGTGVKTIGATAVTISNTTITGNSSTYNTFGGGIRIQSTTGTLALGSTILKGNSDSGVADDLHNFAAISAFTSLGNNVVGTTIGPATYVGTDQTGVTNAKLGTLGSYGGLTQTIPLLPLSPALGHGNCATLSGITPSTRDQRGVPRKTPCDVGAYEKAAATTFEIQKVIGLYRPSNDTFYLAQAGTIPVQVAFTTVFGSNAGGTTIYPVVGDWDGDGIDTVGVLRGNEFLLKNSNSINAPIVYDFVLGAPGDLPMAGDWTGAGRSGVGVFRPSNGLIFLKNSPTTGFADFQMVLGIPGDKPVAGDWDGNGIYSPGVYRPSTTTFYLTNSVCNCAAMGNYTVTLGASTDLPVAGDWTGIRHTGVGVFRPSNTTFYLKNALVNGAVDRASTFGAAGDLPVAGHWTVPVPAIRNTADTPTATAPKLALTFVP
ncbi:MAG: right-handed parallel beta-helix repeat-containing protein [Chloroflexota bacterium]